ncbi:citrate lyase ligase [Butyrivibrio sp. AD3002]|uniref:citrate lyase ligase n=1 Tax=Butyrivibrio sp. AD3002 TaxID=1280670 RepID=UPI0003B3DF52|nr:citrate lyase ligase [Butyrivibrio sp. AD3002]
MTLEELKCNYDKEVVLLGERFYIQLFLDWNFLDRQSYYVCDKGLYGINGLNIIEVEFENMPKSAVILYCGLDQGTKDQYRDNIDIDVFNLETINDNGTYTYDNITYVIDDVKFVSSNPPYMKYAYPRINLEDLQEYLQELSLAPASRRVDENGQICLWNYSGEYINQKDGRRITKNMYDKAEHIVHVFGDSRVSGFMLADDDLFTNILQKRFKEKGIAYNVINYGIPGREIDRMEYQIKKAGIKAGDIVFICTGCYEYREQALDRQRQYIMHIKSAKNYCDSIGAFLVYINLPTTVEILNMSPEEALITELYKNYKFRDYSYEIIDYYKEFIFLKLEKYGIYCHDLAIEFNKYRNDLLFINMHHYSPAGNKIMADYMLQLINIIETTEDSKAALTMFRDAQKANDTYSKEGRRQYSLMERTHIDLGGWKRIYNSDMRFRFKTQMLACLKEITKEEGDNGAIVMNANPFTKGHLYLVEYASKVVNHLYVIVLEEDKSDFSFMDRFKMVYLGCGKMKNVTVISGGRDVISDETFPEYFMKAELQDTKIDALKDIERFATVVAPKYGIKKRFVGEEPFDIITNQYNEQMRQYLPRWGVELVEIPRRLDENDIISASNVRKALKENDWETVYRMVPVSTYNYLRKMKKNLSV